MAWWAAHLSDAKESSKTVDLDDDDDAIIDLTSDTETASPSSPGSGAGASPATASSGSNGVEVLSPWAVKMTSEWSVKSEDKKRTAEASKKAEQSGEVQVTPKPPQKIDEIENRPAKRSKWGGAGAEDDLEMVGTTGTAKLPHNRFACTEHPFTGWHGNTEHKEKCALCYCYVCDRLANDCKEWNDHCHATDSGGFKSSWKSLRQRAKPLLQAGKSPPVSGRYLANAPPPLVGVFSPTASNAAVGNGASAAASSPAAASASSSSSGSRWPFSKGQSALVHDPNASLPNACNCEALCKPIHKVFRFFHQYNGFAKAGVAAVYLKGLTLEQVDHVQNISVQATVDRTIQKRVGLHTNPNTLAAYNIARYDREATPIVQVKFAGVNKRDVTVAGVDPQHPAGGLMASDPFAVKWKPGDVAPHAAIAVRLGGVTNISFKMNLTLKSTSERQEYFDRFVSESPMAQSVWSSTARHPHNDRFEAGPVMIAKVADTELLKQLKDAYEQEFVDVEAKAVYNASANVGSFSLEVILLNRLLRRGTSLQSRSGHARDVDFVPIVERVILKRTFQHPSSYSKKKGVKNLSPSFFGGSGAGSSAGAGAAAVALGREFTPSTKGYGGRSSLDVSLSGLVNSVRDEESNSNISAGAIISPAKMLLELENLQHRSLPKQPDCLTVQLFEHQKQDAQWMMDQELLQGGTMQHLWAELPQHPLAPSGPPFRSEFRRCWFSPVLNQFTLADPFTSTMKGGILCDEMGLGKTAATLCLHLIHPAKTPSPGVPLDEKEWGSIAGLQAEKLTNNAVPGIASRTEAPGTFVSKGTLVVCKVSLVGQWVEEAKRLCGGALTIYPYHGGGRRKDPEFLTKYDMVVTTYGVVQADASRNRQFPPLRRIRWWRVVLDESHTIASTSSTTKMVKELIANRRWCMTGTPYISRFSDVNGQLGFIGAEGAFKAADLGDRGANTRTQSETVAFLRRVLLRHSQGMKLGGKSILGLPSITHKVEVLTMPTKERDAYVEFEKGIQKDFCKVRYRLRNMNGSHTMEVLTLLSKFRQACSGGQLLVADSTAAGGAASGSSGTATVDAFCSICNEILESPVRTSCGHIFCQACITSMLTKTNNDQGPCPKCKTTVSLSALTLVGGGGSVVSSGGGGSGYGAKSEPREHVGGEGSSSSAGASSSSAKPGVVMETKLKALVAKLAGIHAKDPTSKSLVFSQFNSSLEWLKRTLPKKGFQFRTLTGSMSRSQRTAALTAFANDPPTTVFLLSVRSGAVGINLTQANNVFLLEPLLNLALEKQAVGRVYRLGQARPVVVTKLVLKDSIETRILDVQKKQAQQGASSAAVGAASNTVAGNIARDNAKNLKIEEYNELFGVTEEKKESPPSKYSSFSSFMDKALAGHYDDEEDGDY